ncbi:DUF6125 family protein [Paucidesulfovibrio longus]|uniref:DUF6125 family protein n=1 Tax=Paucidesulfovibrio longus TaxID=889 RepID=UPI0003B5A860|nr:DUF6125 family protein [Paucidesulfovibrio longus]
MLDDNALILDFLRRTMAHYGLWFAEAVHQVGLPLALEAEREAGDRWLAIALKRLAKTTGQPMKDGLPAFLADMDEQKKTALLETLAVNWLAADGVWFQAIETRAGMHDAKRANDTCWSRFSPLEAARIKALLELEDEAGLAGLKAALGCRLYARINEQEIVDEGDAGFTFRMTRCRVQDARTRKGLPDYPCKSGGCVEYTSFARTIDPRIKTECIACPPDEHPAEWVCAWRFEIGK